LKQIKMKSERKKPRNIEFTLEAPGAKAVAIAGTFNGWDSTRTPLRAADGSGVWKVTMPLPQGRYEYRFIVDDGWVSDPQAKESVPNPFGGQNSVIIV
jgi:1,4-alpha-glucan branching enzyme